MNNIEIRKQYIYVQEIIPCEHNLKPAMLESYSIDLQNIDDEA
jgi:hypothetical protein